jgi:hypothetical protein
MMFVPHRKHTCGPPLPVTGIALLFYMQMMFVSHRKHTYGPPQPVTGFAFIEEKIMFLLKCERSLERSVGL